MNNKSRLFLIDATAFCYRAFYAIGGLSTSFGQPTNAVYGFLNILNKILKEHKPGYIAACFDVSRDTFRARKFAEYKIQRPPMPDGLTSQIPLIKELIGAYGITLLEKSGYEADDIIATVAQKAKKEGMLVTIVTSDKDMLQLVDEFTVVFNPYKEGGVIYDIPSVEQRFGVSAGQIPDIIALMGDDADNIPGAKGIGEKTAVTLVQSFGSIENLLANISQIKQEKLKAIVSENTDIIRLSKDLALLDGQANIDFNLDNLKLAGANRKELFRLFKYLEFKKLLKELPIEKEGAKEIEIVSLNDGQLEGVDADQIVELLIYGQSSADMVFYAPVPRDLSGIDSKGIIPGCSGDKFFRVEKIGKNIKAVLADPEVKKIGHDLKKLKVALAGEDVILEGVYFDTMVAAYLVNPSRGGYGLSDIVLEYLELGPLPDIVEPGPALDFILRLKPKLEKELIAKNLLSLFNDIEMPLVEVLAEMELKGIKVDLELLRDLSGNLEKRLIGLIEEIYNLSGTQFNINSPKQLREILFERLKLPVGRKSKTGPSTDEEVLRKLAQTHKLPELLLEYRQLTKLKTTYVDALPELVDPVTGRIHTSFNQAATETGRLSSSRPNLQNLPIKTEIGSKIRQAVIPFDKNNYLLSCDYSQIELRILAHLSKDENLISAFKENKDIHKATAALIFGIEEKDVTGQMRESAKRVNFGIVYGLSAYGLAKDLNIPIQEAQSFIDAYFLRYPKVSDYTHEQIQKAQAVGFVSTILGRRRYIPEINNKNQTIRQLAERQAVNTPIQGSASDLIKLAMIKVYARMKLGNFKSSMLLQIHDELVFDVPGGECNEFSAVVKDIMENVLALDVPLQVNIKKGKNWLEAE